MRIKVFNPFKHGVTNQNVIIDAYCHLFCPHSWEGVSERFEAPQERGPPRAPPPQHADRRGNAVRTHHNPTGNGGTQEEHREYMLHKTGEIRRYRIR
jgi:hypothetical protein